MIFPRRVRHGCLVQSASSSTPRRAARPSIFMVDDIQWADDASAQVLHYLARQAARRPDARDLCLSRRGGRQRRAVRSPDRELAPRDRRAPLPLARLGPADTESLVAALADSIPRRIRVGRATASRNRRQSVLPDFDSAVLDRRRDATGTARERRGRDCCRTRCGPPCACGSRTCPRSSGRCSKPPRFSAGASTSILCST